MNRMEQGVAVYLGKERLKRLQAVTVGVAGAGGLGSNCAMFLVRSGFKRFVIVDHDTVDASNLNRQLYDLDQLGEPKVEALARNLRAVNPDLELELKETVATPDTIRELFAGCDVVVECFDDPVCKKTLVEALLQTDILVVAASGIGGTGDSDAIVTRRVRDNFYVVGDMKTECSMKKPPLAPKVILAAAKQADVVLSHYLTADEEERQ